MPRLECNQSYGWGIEDKPILTEGDAPSGSWDFDESTLTLNITIP